jgi:2-polyprenyl-3-methyl-5-hydroxy-6-metoxy-1,4-benzoquinol methylase
MWGRAEKSNEPARAVMMTNAYSDGETHRCWVCGGTSRRFRPSTIRGHVDSTSLKITDSHYGETAALSECRSCGFVFADPVPHPSLLDLYRGVEDQPYQDSSFARRAQMRQLLDLMATFRPRARTLFDIGAGTGLLVAEARDRGLTAQGVEPSRWCVETAAAVNRVELFCGTAQEWADRLSRYDIVTLVDVVEHTVDPLGMIREGAALLSPGGALLIVTPDIGSFAARLMGRWWWHHRVAHVGYFNRASMRRALEEARLTLEADTHATWRFPATYLVERLVQYLPMFPIGTVLRRLGRSSRLGRCEVGVNLRDSRAFIASAGGA